MSCSCLLWCSFASTVPLAITVINVSDGSALVSWIEWKKMNLLQSSTGLQFNKLLSLEISKFSCYSTSTKLIFSLALYQNLLIIHPWFHNHIEKDLHPFFHILKSRIVLQTGVAIAPSEDPVERKDEFTSFGSASMPTTAPSIASWFSILDARAASNTTISLSMFLVKTWKVKCETII